MAPKVSGAGRNPMDPPRPLEEERLRRIKQKEDIAVKNAQDLAVQTLLSLQQIKETWVPIGTIIGGKYPALMGKLVKAKRLEDGTIKMTVNSDQHPVEEFKERIEMHIIDPLPYMQQLFAHFTSSHARNACYRTIVRRYIEMSEWPAGEHATPIVEAIRVMRMSEAMRVEYPKHFKGIRDNGTPENMTKQTLEKLVDRKMGEMAHLAKAPSPPKHTRFEKFGTSVLADEADQADERDEEMAQKAPRQIPKKLSRAYTFRENDVHGDLELDGAGEQNRESDQEPTHQTSAASFLPESNDNGKSKHSASTILHNGRLHETSNLPSGTERALEEDEGPATPDGVPEMPEAMKNISLIMRQNFPVNDALAKKTQDQIEKHISVLLSKALVTSKSRSVTKSEMGKVKKNLALVLKQSFPANNRIAKEIGDKITNQISILEKKILKRQVSKSTKEVVGPSQRPRTNISRGTIKTAGSPSTSTHLAEANINDGEQVPQQPDADLDVSALDEISAECATQPKAGGQNKNGEGPQNRIDTTGGSKDLNRGTKIKRGFATHQVYQESAPSESNNRESAFENLDPDSLFLPENPLYTQRRSEIMLARESESSEPAVKAEEPALVRESESPEPEKVEKPAKRQKTSHHGRLGDRQDAPAMDTSDIVTSRLRFVYQNSECGIFKNGWLHLENQGKPQEWLGHQVIKASFVYDIAARGRISFRGPKSGFITKISSQHLKGVDLATVHMQYPASSEVGVVLLPDSGSWEL